MGRADGQDCAALAEGRECLRFLRAGRRFAVCLEIAGEIVVVDVIPGRADLPRRLHALRDA